MTRFSQETLLGESVAGWSRTDERYVEDLKLPARVTRARCVVGWVEALICRELWRSPVHILVRQLLQVIPLVDGVCRNETQV